MPKSIVKSIVSKWQQRLEAGYTLKVAAKDFVVIMRAVHNPSMLNSSLLMSLVIYCVGQKMAFQILKSRFITTQDQIHPTVNTNVIHLIRKIN